MKKTEVAQGRNLCKNGGGCSSLQINTFYDTPFSGTPPHPKEVCLLGSNGEAEDLPLETHQTFVVEISDEERDIPLEKYSEVPCLQSPKCQPNDSLEAGSSRHLSHEQVTEHAGGCREFYDPVAKYMEGLGEGNDWSCLCLKHQFVYHSLLPLSVSFFPSSTMQEQ